jgi:hypothetical protein
MKETLKLIPVVLYFIVGMISLAMAFKNLLADKYLPFHEQAAGKSWDAVEEPLKPVILSLLRLSGLGFLIVSVLMVVFPAVNFFIPDAMIKFSVPAIALIYCIGLFVINYLLHIQTKADTPWRGSLYAVFIIVVGIVISIFI